jgi:beta-1,4-mannosyl-glycoprotein beta-1,4-N-acetylglucosaminyltransferase
LRALAAECASVVEIGLRSMESSWGILRGLSENLSSSRSYIGIDIDSPSTELLDSAKRLAEGNGIAFNFWRANDLNIDIEPTELLFIDSLHTYCHLTYELEKFSPKVSKYIAMHDTSWGEPPIDDPAYQGNYSEYPSEYDRTKRGLWQAVVDFLQRHPEWTLHERRVNNYGFTILKRISNDPPKIYDCFTFFNELDILEIKLNELYDHVDHFVLVESTETFRGNPKPLYFTENKQRFSKFLDKIIHVILDEHLETNSSWDREFYQRNQIMRGLTHCRDEDIIIVEDLDEIVSASKLPEIVAILSTNKLPSVTCNQSIYTYFLNRYGHASGNVVSWLGSMATKYGYLKSISPQELRSQRDGATAVTAGWHFTYMGGTKKVQTKLESFSHSELDNDAYKHPARIRQDVEALKLVNIDESYPKFVREHIPYLTELGLIDN